MRIAYTIILNGLHHLLHDGYAERLIKDVDYWVFVEGVAGTQGSTSWCQPVPGHWHDQGHSIDGTLEYLDQFCQRHKKCCVIQAGEQGWKSKDEMVSAALDFFDEQFGSWIVMGEKAFLWQIDADEVWDEKDMAEAEKTMVTFDKTRGDFFCDYFVGHNLVARGEWGEGFKVPYRRLWLWNGEGVLRHEPPLLKREEREIMLPQRFKHYAYYYPQDVLFKEDFYGDIGLYERWVAIQKETEFPIPVSKLISGSWGRTETMIESIKV